MNFSLRYLCTIFMAVGFLSGLALASGFGKNGRGEYLAVSESGRIGLFDADYSTTTLSRQGKTEAELDRWSLENKERPFGTAQYMSVNGLEVFAQATLLGTQWRVRLRTIQNDYSGNALIIQNLPTGTSRVQLVEGGVWYADANGLNFQKWTSIGAGGVVGNTRIVISGFSAAKWQVSVNAGDTTVVYSQGGTDVSMSRSSGGWSEEPFGIDGGLSGFVKDIAILDNSSTQGILLLNSGVLLQCPTDNAPYSCEILDTIPHAIALTGQNTRFTLQLMDGRVSGYELRGARFVPQGLVWPGWTGRGTALSGTNHWGVEWGSFVDFRKDSFWAVGHQYHPGGLGFKDFVVTPRIYSARLHDNVDLSGVLSAREKAELRWVYARDTADVSSWAELTKDTLTSGMTFYSWFPKTSSFQVMQGNAWMGAILAEGEDSVRVWQNIRFDSLAPTGSPTFTGALEAKPEWLISSGNPLVIHLEDVKDRPGVGDSFKVEIELKQEGVSYAYRWEKWSVGSTGDNLLINGKSIGNMPLPSGIYQVRWRLVDLVGNSTDWVDSVMISGQTVSRFEVNPLPALMEALLSPNVLGSSSGGRMVATVDLLARKGGKFVIHYRLDAESSDLVIADTVLLSAGESRQLKRTLRVAGISEGIHQIRVTAHHADGGDMSIAVPFVFGQAATQIISPQAGEFVEDGATIRGVVNPGPAYPAVFRVYRTYQTEGIVSIATGLSWIKLMSLADWQPMLVPFGQQLAGVNSVELHPNSDARYPNSNLGESANLAGGVLAYFQATGRDSVYTLMVVSEWKNAEGAVEWDYDWVVVNSAPESVEPDTLKLVLDRDTLDMSDAITVNDTAHITIETSAPMGSQVEWVLSQGSKVASGRLLVGTGGLGHIQLVSKNVLGQQLPSGEYDLYVQVAGARGGTLQQRRSVWVIAPGLSMDPGVLKVLPNPLLWNPAIAELSHVQVDVNLPVPAIYRVEIHKPGSGLLRILADDHLARGGSHLYDLTDADGKLLMDLWTKDTVFLTAKIFVVDSLIAEKQFSVIAAELLQSAKSLLVTSSLTADSVQSGFRFQALAKGPISYYPQRLVDYSSNISGEQVLKYYKDVPYYLNFRKFYNSVELLSSSYYRVRKVDFINLLFGGVFQDNRERNTEPLIQRYSFFNAEDMSGQDKRSWTDQVRMTPQTAENNLWYGDYPALDSSFLLKMSTDKPSKLLDPSGQFINVSYPFQVGFATATIRDLSVPADYGWMNFSSFYNVQNPWLGTLRPSDKPAFIDDRYVQAFAASSTIKLGDDPGDDEWRTVILDGYVNVSFMKRQDCEEIDAGLVDYAAKSPLSNDFQLSEAQTNEGSKYFGELIYTITTPKDKENTPVYPKSGDIVDDLFQTSTNWKLPGESVYMTNKESNAGLDSYSSWDFSWSDFGYDKYKARVYTYRPEINWEHPYLQNDGELTDKFLNFRRQNGPPTYYDPAPWAGEKSCSANKLETRVVARRTKDATYQDTLRYCTGSHGGPKHGVRGFVYKLDTTFVNRFNETLRPDQVIRNFYDRNMGTGHVYWSHPAFDVEYLDATGNVLNSSQGAAGARLRCRDAKTDIKDDLVFSPRLESDSLYALGVVWDTATVSFPLLAGADTLFELDPRTNLPYAFGEVKGLSRYPYRNDFDTLKSSRYARDLSGGNYVDTIVYDLMAGYDSLKKVLDTVVMVPSNPLAIYNYIRSNNLEFHSELKSKELDARGRIVDSTAFVASNTYLHAEIDDSNGKHLLKVFYKAVPRSMATWNASLDTSFAATNGWLYGQGNVNRQMFLAQDSGLEGGFLRFVGTKGLNLPQASPYSMAPFVMDSGVVAYNPNLDVDSLQWDLHIYQMDGVTPTLAVSVVGANSQNMRLELQSQATLQAVLPIRGHIDSVLVQNGERYRFASYRLQWKDTAKSHAIVANRFFVRPDGDAYVGDIVPDTQLDFWAVDKDSVPTLGYWNTTGLNGFYRVSLVVSYYRESDSAFATLYEEVPVALGHRIKSGAEVLELSSQEKRASLSMPAQYLDSQTLVSMHTLAPSEIGELAGLPNVLPVGPVLRVSTTGSRLFDEKNMPTVTYRISARELFAMKGLSDFDNADTGAIYSRMRQDSGAYQIHILGDNGKLEVLPTMVALNYALESGTPVRFDRDAASLILSASVPHFSYILLLPTGTKIPDYDGLDSLSASGPWTLKDWTDGPDPLVPACGSVAYTAKFVSDRQGALTRVLLDNSGTMLRYDPFVVSQGVNELNWDGCADGKILVNGVYHFEYRFTEGLVIVRSAGIGLAAGSVYSVTVDRDPFVPGVNGEGPGLTISARVRGLLATRIHFVVLDSLGDTLWTSASQTSRTDVDGSSVHTVVWNGLMPNGGAVKTGPARVEVVVDAMDAPSAVKWFVIGVAAHAEPVLQQVGALASPVKTIGLNVQSEEALNALWMIVSKGGDTSKPLNLGPASLGKGLSLVNLASGSTNPSRVGMQWTSPSGMGGIAWLDLVVQDPIPGILELEAMGGDTLDPEIPAEWVARMGGQYSDTAGYTWNSEGYGSVKWSVSNAGGAVIAQDLMSVNPGYGGFSWAPFDGNGKAYEEGAYRMAVYAVSPAGRDSLLTERTLYVRRIPDVVVVLPDQATTVQKSRAVQLRDLLVGRGVRRVNILDGAGVSAYLGYATETSHQGLVAFVDSVPPRTLFSGEARNPVYLALRKGFNFAFLGAQPLRWKHGTSGTPVKTPGAALPLFRMADSYLRPEELVGMDDDLFTGNARTLQVLDSALADGFSYALSPLTGVLQGEAVRIGKYRSSTRRARSLDTAANATGESGVRAHSAFYRPDPSDGAFLVFNPYGVANSALLVNDYAWMIDRFFFTPDIGIVENGSDWASSRKDSHEVARGSKVTFHVRVRATGRQPLDSRLVLKAPANNWNDTVEILALSPYVDGADYALTMPIAANTPFDTMEVVLSLAPVQAQDPTDSMLIRHETDLTNNEWRVKLVIEDTVAPKLLNALDLHDTLPGFLSTGVEGYPYLVRGPVYTNHGFGSVKARLRLLSLGATQLELSDSCLAKNDSIRFSLSAQRALSAIDTGTIRLDLEDKYGNDTSYYWTLRLDGKRPAIADLKVANALATDSVDGKLRYLGGAGDAAFQAAITDDKSLRAWFLVHEADTLAADSSEKWAQQLNFALSHTVSAGEHQLLVRDSAGNMGRAMVLYGKDSVAPVLNVYRVLAPHLPPDTATAEDLMAWRLYPNQRKDSLGIQPIADSVFIVGGGQPGDWSTNLDVRNMTTVGLVVWVTESNPAGNPGITLTGGAGLDTLILPRSIYVSVNPSSTQKVQFSACDLVGNCSQATLVLENPAPDLAYVDAVGDGIAASGLDFGELHVHRYDSLGVNYLSVALHSYTAAPVDQAIHLNVYMDLDNDKTTGAQVTLADGKSISGADARLEIRKLSGDDRDISNILAVSHFENGVWAEQAVVEGNAQNLQNGLALGVNQLDALWSRPVGEGYQVMPGGRVATAPGGVLELRWNTAGAADSIQVFVDDGNDAVYDTALVRGLPMVAKSPKTLHADGRMSDWWPSVPAVATYSHYAVESSTMKLQDTTVVVNVVVRNEGLAGKDRLGIWIPISMPANCSDVSVRPASPPGLPIWVAPSLSAAGRSGVLLQVESASLTAGSRWEIPAVVVKGCGLDADEWASRVGTAIVEDVIP